MSLLVPGTRSLAYVDVPPWLPLLAALVAPSTCVVRSDGDESWTLWANLPSDRDAGTCSLYGVPVGPGARKVRHGPAGVVRMLQRFNDHVWVVRPGIELPGVWSGVPLIIGVPTRPPWTRWR